MPTEELIDEVDSRGTVLSTHPKSYFKERMFLHKASLVIPITKNGDLVLSRRAVDKFPFPGTWCCAVGGKALSNENEEAAAKREMKEEIGKIYPIKKVVSFLYDEADYKAIFSLFKTTSPVEIMDFVLDPSEIAYPKAFPIQKVLEMIESDPKDFAPTFVAAIKEFAKYNK